MDFKTMLHKDMEVFHDISEFAEILRVWYQGKMYELPLIIDHETQSERSISSGDHAEGIYKIDAVVYMSFDHLGFVPKKGRNFDIEDATGAETDYTILKSHYEDGQIILYLQEFEE